MEIQLKPLTSAGATVTGLEEGHVELTIPAGNNRQYRIAQIDNYSGLARSRYPHHTSTSMRLEACAGSNNLPGTWGFGLWNAPLGLVVGFGGSTIFPTLPNAAWFFHASQNSHLSFTDDQTGNGFLCQTFRSAQIPLPLLAPAALLFPLLKIRSMARMLRKIISRRLIHDESKSLKEIDVTEWHTYEMQVNQDKVDFYVDDQHVKSSSIVPSGKLGLVIWIDNQYAAFKPGGELRYGVEENKKPASLNVRNLTIT